MSGFPSVALFDLDGTLLDSAPDMWVVINQLRAEHQLPALALDTFRRHVSRGASAMLMMAFPMWDEQRQKAMLPEFLHRYEQLLCRHSAPFAGIETVLQRLEQAGTRWGIITNKPFYLAEKIIALLHWQHRCAILLGGDSLPQRKPDPLPLLYSAEKLGVDSAQCVYVGDDRRDIEAAKAAKMRSIAALWGYRQIGDEPASWQADVMLAQPSDMLNSALWP